MPITSHSLHKVGGCVQKHIYVHKNTPTVFSDDLLPPGKSAWLYETDFNWNFVIYYKTC